jgi:regulator of extracellular matrix RemA (YlzA/DUF370 family)
MSATSNAATSLILTEDFFGVVANQLFTAMSEGTKPERKDAFLTIRQMAKTAKLLTAKEQILSIGVGCNISGQKHISIVLKAPESDPELMKEERRATAVKCAQALIDAGFGDEQMTNGGVAFIADTIQDNL